MDSRISSVIMYTRVRTSPKNQKSRNNQERSPADLDLQVFTTCGTAQTAKRKAPIHPRTTWNMQHHVGTRIYVIIPVMYSQPPEIRRERR